MMFARAFNCVALAIGLIAATPAQQSYAQRGTTVNAGVVLLDSNLTAGVPSNSNPFVWYNLDQNSRVKPAGWDFENPIANAVATQATVNRWTALGGPVPAINDRLTKSEASYWEVSLSAASDTDLSKFDVLSVSIYQDLLLSSRERERLRRFVDQGGVLWIDVTDASPVDYINNLPVPFKIVAGSGSLFADFFHPLLSYPNILDSTALNSIQIQGSGVIAQITAGDLAGMSTTQFGSPADFLQFQPVVRDGSNNSAIAVAQLGNGYILVTARGTAQALNRTLVSGNPSVYSVNQTFYAQTPTFDQSSNAAARLMVNAISLPTTHGMPQQGSRGMNGSPVDMGAPLLRRWKDIPPIAAGALSTSTPALFKGLMIVSVNDPGGSRVYVYNAKPGTDLDGTGSADKGIPDYLYGQQQDLLWKSAVIPGPISSPTCLEVPSAGASGFPLDQILVVGGDGALYAFDAFNIDAATHHIRTPLPIGTPPDATETDVNWVYGPLAPTGSVTVIPAGGPSAPTIHEGLAFIADSQNTGSDPAGRIWIVDPATGIIKTNGASELALGGAAAPGLNGPSSSPTIGYIPIQDNSGGVDRVVYLASGPTSVGGPSSTAGITSLWLGARGEKPASFDAISSPGLVKIFTRASLSPGCEIYQAAAADPFAFKLTVLDQNGIPLPQATMSSVFSGAPTYQVNGEVDVPCSAWDPTWSGVRIDYTIDWAVSPVTSVIRGNEFFPDDTARARRVIGSPALGPDGTLFVVVSTQNDGSASSGGGDLYALSESGRGVFKLLYRFSLYGEHQITESQGETVDYKEVLYDNDGVTSFSPFIQGSISNLTFSGAPAIRGSVVYVTARGIKNAVVPVTVLLALKADPEPVEIRTGDLQPNFQLAQPEITGSDTKNVPERYNLLLPNQYTYTKDPGAPFGTIHIDSLMSSQRGSVQNAFSASQPILIRQAGLPDQLVEPSASGGFWNPLLWYSCFNGYDNRSAPMVTGNTVFFAATSMLPSILSTGAIGPLSGLLVGMNSDISTSDPGNTPDSGFPTGRNRPWLVQANQINLIPSFTANPNFRWPQIVGSTGIADYALRLNQTVLDGSTTSYGVVAGEGTLASLGDNGVYAYGLADFFVADEGRLARFDSSGNALFTSDVSLQTGLQGDVSNVGNLKPLVRPTRAYPLSQREMIVVDPGANRLAEMTTSGRETRSIEKMIVDSVYRVDGFNTNEPLTLNSPRDVAVYQDYVLAANNPLASPMPYEFWIHYIIADAGNKRLIELVDRYGADITTNEVRGPVAVGGAPQIGVLYWHSPSTFTGKNWEYGSVAREILPDGLNSRPIVVAGIGSAGTTSTDVGLGTPAPGSQREEGTGNGSILVFDGANSQVITSVLLPAVPTNTIWKWTNGVPALDPSIRSGRQKKLSNLSSVTMKIIPAGAGAGQLSIMFTDSTGVYEIVKSGSDWVVTWMLTNDAYKAMRGLNAPFGGAVPMGSPDNTNPLDLRATYARRLPSNEVLIVNGYSGSIRSGGGFSGEILQVNGDVDGSENNAVPGFGFTKTNFGFGTNSIRFKLGPIEGARGLLIPVFADRR